MRPVTGKPASDAAVEGSGKSPWVEKILQSAELERKRAGAPEQASEPLLVFTSEDKRAELVEDRAGSQKPDPPSPVEVRSSTPKPNPPPPVRPVDPAEHVRLTIPLDPLPSTRASHRVAWRRVAISILILFALVEAVVIGMWLKSRAAVPTTGVVTITSDPAGAPVTIDETGRGDTPMTVSLSSGMHQVRVGLGSVERTQSLNVAAGSQSSIHVELRSDPAPAPLAATGLQINTDPTGAQVSVDGQIRGRSPISISSLKPGVHVVSATGPSGAVTQKVTVADGLMSAVMISMPRNGEFTSGWLAINSPILMEIHSGNTLLGNTNTPKIMLPVGTHNLTLANAALAYQVQRRVQVEAGKTATLTVAVPDGTLHVNALPWAEVWLGARRLGETPIANLSIPIGTHELIFRHPELGEHRRTVTVTTGAPVRVGLDLRKAP